MAPFSKPVLKQAEGLVSVGKTHAVLQFLTEMLSSKRFRSIPLGASLEPIMHHFVELCNIAQNTSVQCIEAVITRFVQLADQKVRDAQAKAASVQVTVQEAFRNVENVHNLLVMAGASGSGGKKGCWRAR
ncbi:hypothetical protein B0H14DRAFT_3908090 [Mycena olivaceomarginata]|nr:hypothetical protein B0H14DRAFT_3908090 [Mycena olivaceomarginata]